jgi:amino acid adenylation domain-containing protein
MLAVMKAGGASVAIDSSLPEERLRSIVEQVDAVIILSSSNNQELAGRLTQRPTVVVDAGHFNTLSTVEHRVQQQLSDVQPWNKLYVVFTSGTTGTPKGAIITHSNFSSAIRHQQAGLGFTSSSRVYDFASYAFDISWFNFLNTLTAGGCLCIPSAFEARNDIAGSILSYNATFVELTPTVASTLRPSDVTSLKQILFSGELLTGHLASLWAKQVLTLNSYGPTECIRTTFEVMNQGSVTAPSIGKGVGLCAWIVRPSDHNVLVPVGVVGELLLEGPLVGAGYLGDLEKTTTAFIENPAWLLRGAPGQPGRHGRLYKTGDLVRYSPDGSMIFVGRKDAQVKINGQRVELGDIEYHIRMSLPSDSEVQILADIIIPHDSEKAILVAFIQITDTADATDATEMTTKIENKLQDNVNKLTVGLDDRLATTVPAHMIPLVYIAVKSVPMTATGKTDRRNLRAMGERMTIEELTRLNGPGSKRLLPTTLMERKLQELWSTVLGIKADRIGANDSFLRIGGDSIGAMRLVGVLREQNLHLTVADIFKQPRLRDMARIVHEFSKDDNQKIQPFSLLRTGLDLQIVRKQIAVLCDVDMEQIEDIFPCTSLQEGLFALSAKRPGDYIAQFVFELKSTIDIDVFRSAWEELQRTTPILRTRIVNLVEQGLVQVVVQREPNAGLYSLGRYTQAVKQLNIDFGSPLMRVAIVEGHENESGEDKGKGKRFFIWTIHHALYDGWSMPLMIERLSHAYYSRTTLSNLRLFQGFIKHIINIDQSRARDFWETQFKDLRTEIFPSLPSPTYQPRSDTSITYYFQNLEWPETDVTASTVVRTAWAILIAHYTDSDDIVFGVTVTGRQADISGIDQMAGPTIATVPVRIVLDREETLDRLLLRVQAQAVEMTAFEQIGLQNIRRISANAERACAFQTLLVIHSSDEASDEQTALFTNNNTNNSIDKGESIAASEFDTHCITIDFHLQDRGSQLQIEFDSAVINKEQINRLAKQFEFTLRQTCDPKNVDIKLANFESISQEDLCCIWDWNQTVPETVDMVVHDLIAETTKRQSNAPAISAWDGDWTYAELDNLATRLAYHLASLGVGPDVIVPLCFEKSKWTPVAMLAVMKAGGASVVMDSNLPEERLRSIVEQVEPTLILSSVENRELAGRLTQRPTVIVTTDDVHLEQLSVIGELVERQLPVVKPSNKLYVIFTSGSTGTPKGVIITHSNFSSAIQHQQTKLGFTSSSRVFDFASYAFDVAWSNFLNTLTAGGCLCIPSETDRKNDLAGSIHRMHATFADLTPSTASLLPTATIQDLHTLILGGESLPSKFAQKWAGVVNLKNPYGPSECTPTATLESIDPNNVSRIGIGKGIGLNTWVVNTATGDSLMPLGSIGELYLEGPLVGAGYLGDLEKTAAAFIEDPPWLLRGGPGQPGRRGRLYKTGDLVRYNLDGRLTFIGRKDAQVKINGQRVELGDVEYFVRMNLSHHKNIQVVAEMVMPRESKKMMLIAFLEISSDELTAKDENKPQDEVKRVTAGLNDRLATQLPTYMIPSAYIAITRLPMTVTGKIDRRQLRAMGERLTLEELTMLNASDRNRRPATTPMERRLQDIWSIVLGIDSDHISADDNFLRIGGDSINAIQLVLLARQHGIKLTVSSIFKSASLSDMALSAILSDDEQTGRI